MFCSCAVTKKVAGAPYSARMSAMAAVLSEGPSSKVRQAILPGAEAAACTASVSSGMPVCRSAAPAARQYAAAQSPSRQTRPSPTLFQVIIFAPSPLYYSMRHTGGAVLRTGSGPVRLFPETGA